MIEENSLHIESQGATSIFEFEIFFDVAITRSKLNGFSSITLKGDPSKVFRVHVMLPIHSFMWLKIRYDKSRASCVVGSIGDHFLFEVGGFIYIECDTFLVCN